MPGLYGYIKVKFERSCISKMTDSMLYMDHFTKDSEFEDSYIAASRTHLDKIGMSSSPLVLNDIAIWIEGECYNLDELNDYFAFSHNSFGEGLALAYMHCKLDEYLNKTDGYFCAVIYDQLKNKLYLISDRHGMRMLYLYSKDGRFAWSSEVKGLLALDWVEKKIKRSSIDCFLNLGFLLAENTWFENISLIKPATVVEFDINTLKLAEHHYWKWSEIQQQKISFEDAVEKTGQLLINAVKRQYCSSDKIGISLSGGLDSRALIAAVNHIDPAYSGYAYTFGVNGCLDVNIAKQVIAKTNWRHEVFEFNKDNWFAPRLERVWYTDGMLNLMHMHGSEFLHEINKHMSINLNGYAGDVILGGGFLNKLPANTRINKDVAKLFFKEHFDLIDIESDFYDIPHAEPAIYMSRVRRFTNMGTVNMLSMLDQRKPFCDKKLIEFIFSIDDGYRIGNRLYSAALLHTIPNLFKDIPWQKTGKTIDKNLNIFNKISRKAHSIVVKFGFSKDLDNYTNYQEWIRSPEIASTLTDLLKPQNSIYPNYINCDLDAKYLQPHLKVRGVDNSEQILAAVTMEVYFRGVFK